MISGPVTRKSDRLAVLIVILYTVLASATLSIQDKCTSSVGYRRCASSSVDAVGDRDLGGLGTGSRCSESGEEALAAGADSDSNTFAKPLGADAVRGSAEIGTSCPGSGALEVPALAG